MAKPKTWTVMVYMAAGDTPDLDNHAVRDLREMERATTRRGVNVVVQINRDWPDLPQRYRVTKGQSVLDATKVRSSNTGEGATLLEFLSWALKQHRADQYFLVLWGHAFGLGFGRDHQDPLTLVELKRTLEGFRRKRRGKPLELLGANACAMSYAEAAFELRKSVRYLVASQVAVPFAGWPYESILRSIQGTSAAQAVGEIVVNSYVNSFTASSVGDPVAMSLLNLGNADPLRPKLRAMASAISKAMAQGGISASDRLTQLRAAFLATAVGDVRPLIDLSDLCDELDDLCEDYRPLTDPASRSRASLPRPLKALQNAAVQLRSLVKPAVEQVGLLPPVSAVRGAPTNTGTNLVVLHKRHSELEGLHGLGIFAPFVTDEEALKRLGLGEENLQRRARRSVDGGRALYKKLDLMSRNPWETLVYDNLRQELPIEIEEVLGGTGATNRADKSAILQMLVSVDAVFNRLDRTVASATARTRQLLAPAGYAVRGATAGLAPVSLSHFDKLQLLDRTTLSSEPAPLFFAPKPAAPSPANPAVADALDALHRVEKVLADIERAVRGTLTHGTFGLGPGATGFGFREGKPQLGEGKPQLGEGKPQLGEGKPQLGEGKPRLGDEGKPRLGVPSSVVSQLGTSALAVAELFQQVGDSLGLLEAAVGSLESTTARALTGGLQAGQPSSSSANTALAAREIERAARILADASADARRAVRRVLADPLYGVGLGPGGVRADDRRELARIGGFNSRALVLL